MHAFMRALGAGSLAWSANMLLFLPSGWLAGRFFWQDAPAAVTVTLISTAAAAEAIAGWSHSAAKRAGGPEDFKLLNYAQGICLLVGCQADLIWRLSHPANGWRDCALGCTLLILGAVLRTMAIYRLAAGFGNHSAPVLDELCTKGIYRYIRHPAEAGLTLIAGGFAIATQAWPLMPLLLAPLLAMSLIRVTLEDRALRHAFPAAFETYRRRAVF